jgi:hypothetical protein
LSSKKDIRNAHAVLSNFFVAQYKKGVGKEHTKPDNTEAFVSWHSVLSGLPDHLIASGNRDGSRKHMCTPTFVEEKIRAGLLPEVVSPPSPPSPPHIFRPPAVPY